MDQPRRLDDLNLNHLYYFHAVASHGSIAAAARALGMSPSSIGEPLRELELTLGEPLFQRAGRELRVNDAGRLVLEQTALMMGAVERISAQFHPEAHISASLRVGYASSMSRAQVAEDLLPLLELDQTRVRVSAAAPGELLPLLLRGEIELAITDHEPPESVRGSVSYATLPGSPLVVVVPSDALRDETAEVALSRLPLFQYAVGSRFRWELDEYLRKRSLKPLILAEADEPSLMLAATRAGRCFCIVPQAALADSPVGVSVVETLKDAEIMRYALYQGGTTRSLVESAVALLVRGHKRGE